MNEYIKFWDEMAIIEENDLDDENINRLLRWHEVKSNLKGVKTILDIGAGTGVFSIALAQMGYSVTYFDISEEMIHKAKGKVTSLNNISFMVGDAQQLEMFADNQFDLVLNFDGSISFSGHNAMKVISETCRVGKKVILSVSNKACMAATWLNYSLEKFNTIHPSVKEMMVNGYWNSEDYEDGHQLIGIKELKAYDISELKELLVLNRMNVISCHSLGSLTHLYLMHLYRQYDADQVLEKITTISNNEEFLSLCDYFDKNVMSSGMGSFRRAGIIAVGEKLL